MKPKLNDDDYVKYMDDIATSRVAVTIRNYFKGNVSRFYNAFDRFKKRNKEVNDLSEEERKVVLDSIWKDLRHYNLAGIEQKYIKSVFGNNYYSADFMHKAWNKMETLGYHIVKHGTLTYKGQRHTFLTKYLPPQKRLEAIFADKKEVARVISSSSYCNKVKKILDAIVEQNSRKAGKNVDAWHKNKKLAKVPFNSPDKLINDLLLLTKEGNAGTPMSFFTVIEPIVTTDYCEEVRKLWNKSKDIPLSVRNKYSMGYLEYYLKPEELQTMYKNQLNFIMKIHKQLNGPCASRMFKDEKNGYDEDGKTKWKQADEKRIAKAVEAVNMAIAKLQAKLHDIETKSTEVTED